MHCCVFMFGSSVPSSPEQDAVRPHPDGTGPRWIRPPPLVAVFQEDVKRMLAYSSVAQIGYMVLGISLSPSNTGVGAAILHVFNHALMKGALFLAVGAPCLSDRRGHGVPASQAWADACPGPWPRFVVGGLSLMIGATDRGFVSKWCLVLGTLEQDLWPVACWC